MQKKLIKNLIHNYCRDYGQYSKGLMKGEIKKLIRYFTLYGKINKNSISKNYNLFNEIAGTNTGMIKWDGKFLMYRSYVERFLKALFLKEET